MPNCVNCGVPYLTEGGHRCMPVSERKLTRDCPDCPDGHGWSESGPTDDLCKTCGGHAVVMLDGSRVDSK